MNDNEIIKALECISTFDYEICVENKCSYHTGDEMCPCNDVKIAKDALDLINHQKAENERLQKENEFHRKTITENAQRALEVLVDEIDKAKAEAIKEFAEKVETALDERVSEKNRERNPHWYIAKRIVRETAIEMTENITKVEHNSLCETETYKGGE